MTWAAFRSQTHSAPQPFTITVTPVNDPPTFTLGANQSVLHDSGMQSVANFATNITAGPPDESGQTVSFTVGNNSNALFTGLGQPAINASGARVGDPQHRSNQPPAGRSESRRRNCSPPLTPCFPGWLSAAWRTEAVSGWADYFSHFSELSLAAAACLSSTGALNSQVLPPSRLLARSVAVPTLVPASSKSSNSIFKL